MEARDRLINLAVLGAAAVVWALVGLIVTTRDPVADPLAGFIGAAPAVAEATLSAER
jgi:hypothetical protein